MKRLLTTSLIFLMTAVAYAQLPVKFAAMQEITYDDNIYLTNTGTTDSFISATKIGADYKTKIPDSGLILSLNGMGGYNAFTENSSKNSYWDFLGNVDLRNQTLMLGNTFLYTSDPANNALTERAKRINNTTYFSAKSPTETLLGLGVTVSNVLDRYIASEFKALNRNRINAGVQGYYNVSPKTSFFAEYFYSGITYQDNDFNDSKNHALGLGVEGVLSPKVYGVAKITYDMRDYDKTIAGTSDNNELVGYLINVEWKPQSGSILGITGHRRMEETIYFTNRYFADTQIMVYGSQQFYNRFTGSLSLAYNNMSYKYADINNVKRNDNLYTIRPAVDYQFMDWLSAGVWYQMRVRNSNTAGNDYDSNRLGIFVKGTF